MSSSISPQEKPQKRLSLLERQHKLLEEKGFAQAKAKSSPAKAKSVASQGSRRSLELQPSDFQARQDALLQKRG